MGSMIHLSVGRLEIDWGKTADSSSHARTTRVHPLEALWAWGVTGARAPDADRMGERAYRVCAPLAAILPAPPHVFSGLRPLLVPPLKMGSVGSSHRPY